MPHLGQSLLSSKCWTMQLLQTVDRIKGDRDKDKLTISKYGPKVNMDFFYHTILVLNKCHDDGIFSFLIPFAQVISTIK